LLLLFYENENTSRITDASDERLISRQGVKYYGIPELEMGLNWEERKEKADFSSSRSSFDIDRNEEVSRLQLVLRKEFSYRFYFLIDLSRENILHKTTLARFHTDSMQMESRYFISSGIYLALNFKSTRYGNSEWEELGYPFSDDYFKLNAVMTF